MKNAILSILGRIIGETEFSELDPNADLRDALDIDSMDYYNLVMGIHDELGVTIPEEDYGKLTTLQQLTDYVSKEKTLS